MSMLEFSTAIWISAVFGYAGYKFALRALRTGSRVAQDISDAFFAAGLSVLLVLGVVLVDAWLKVIII